MIYASNTSSLLAVARRAAQTFDSYQPSAIVSIVFAAVAVESSVNGLIREASWPLVADRHPQFALLRELAGATGLEERHTPLFRKIHVVHVALAGTRCDTGKQPFQDLDLLLGLRHALVHSRPEKLDVVEVVTPAGARTHHQQKPHPLIARLVMRKVLPSQPKEVLTSLLAALHHPAVGKWAYNTAIDTIDHLLALVPIPGMRESLSVHMRAERLPVSPLESS